MKTPWFQSWHDDWNVTNGFPLAAKGLFREMERWATQGKPYGHITWPSGEVMTVAQMAAATGEDSELIATYVKLMERAGAIGLSKSGGYIMHHLIRRECIRKKRQKSGSLGASVTNGKKRQISGLPQGVPQHVPRPNNDKREKEYWWEGKTIKLNRRDYEAMLGSYGGTDEQFMHWLLGRDRWMNEGPPERKNGWFLSTKKAAANVGNASFT